MSAAQERYHAPPPRESRVKQFVPLLESIPFPLGPERGTPPEIEIARRNEVVRQLDPVVHAMLDTDKYILEVDKLWMANEILPLHDAAHGEALREEASGLSPSTLVTLIGNATTEKGITNYAITINGPPSTHDIDGDGKGGHARFAHGWLAEEKRHDEVNVLYLAHSDAINQRAVNATSTHLIRNGFNPGTGEDPYKLTIFGTIQEDVTDVSHTNEADIAARQGARYLATMSRAEARDERRHRRYYSDLAEILSTVDPNGFVHAVKEVLRNNVVLPAALMTSGEDFDPRNRTTELFDKYDIVSEATGMLTASDFVASFRRHYDLWNIDGLELDDYGEEARHKIKKRLSALEHGAQIKAKKVEAMKESGVVLEFPWLKSRVVDLSTL